jgi:hypothetical protein
MNDPRDFLLDILTATGYKDDKELFIDEFIRNAYLQSFLDLTKTLPSEKQTELKKDFTSVPDNPEQMPEILLLHFQEAQLQEAITNASTKAMSEWLKALEPALTTAQKAKLANVFEDLTHPSSV